MYLSDEKITPNSLAGSPGWMFGICGHARRWEDTTMVISVKVERRGRAPQIREKADSSPNSKGERARNETKFAAIASRAVGPFPRKLRRLIIE
jgi:hypothetical protein